MAERRAVVVGAGIGGLAAAIGLTRAGWQVRVLEQAEELRAVGGGIGLTPNGVRALHALGAGNAVKSIAIEQRHGGVRSPNGRWISHTDLDFIHARYGEAVLAIHRAALVAVLASRLPADALATGSRVLSVDPGGPDRPAEARTGTERLSADLVVAADGIGSDVRGLLFPAHPGLHYAGYTSWRVVVSAQRDLLAGETWGRGRRFSILPLPDGLVHCSALAVASAGDRSGADPDALIRQFGSWHEPIPELIEAVGTGPVLHHDIEELVVPLPRFDVGRVALVGDAAHAMTPNLGSASLALEDAVTISHTVARTPAGSVVGALRLYTWSRRSRSAGLAALSRRIGRLGTLSFPPAVAARDAGFRVAGLAPSFTVRTLDRLMDWRPPAAAA